MGKTFAQNYANLFLGEWEEKTLEKCVLKPSVYWRFLDDIFMTLRYVRTCNKKHDMMIACRKLFAELVRRGYSERFLRKD